MEICHIRRWRKMEMGSDNFEKMKKMEMEKEEMEHCRKLEDENKMEMGFC